MHDRFWTGLVAGHVAVGQNMCYTWSIIGKGGTYEENYLYHFSLDHNTAVRLPQYLSAVAAEPFYSILHFPQYEDFTVTETFDATGSLGGTAGVLRAEFTQDGVEAEGMCSVELVPFPIPGLGGYYMAYSTTIVSAEKGMFQNWEDILTRSLGSLDYSGSYTSSAMAQSDATMGFERVMDTETGEIYQTDNGFTDWYDGNRYTAITDDQYTEAVVGRFSWK